MSHRAFSRSTTEHWRHLLETTCTDTVPTNTSIPKDSQLSPILIMNFTAPLFKAIQDQMGIIAVEYADDAKLIASGRSFYRCWLKLERAWHTTAR